MAVIDDTPETPSRLTGTIDPALCGTSRKSRVTHSYKTLLRAAERLAAERLTMLEAMSDIMLAERKASAKAHAEAGMWQTTNTVNYRLLLVAGAMAGVECVVILYLLFGR